MATTEESLPPLWQPGQGNLETWYRTFEVYAASAPRDNVYFDGPHVAVPVPLSRVEEGLRWFTAHYQPEPDVLPLPTLELMCAELADRRHKPGLVTTRDSGSPCHNLWHWINGS
jgi:hypothetical protein